MGRLIVIEFVSLDGVMEDPDGSQGRLYGGWAFRFGPEAVAGDKFKLGELLSTSTLLLGRVTWERFAQIWPTRDDDFSTQMNSLPKLVVTRGRRSLAEWSNSTRLQGELAEQVRTAKSSGDVVVAGSASVVGALHDRDLVDEFRLLVFPVVLGQGRRLFGDVAGARNLRLVRADRSGAAALLTYARA
jgi:dihydrofolate reductase